MYSILDIDLDYFEGARSPVQRLESLLTWATCPVSIVVERHHHVLARWKTAVQSQGIEPSHILHVDEHHDMMDEKKQPNMANLIYHAMQTWPRCRVHWLVDYPIDSPSMWLDPSTWHSPSRRFAIGAERPANWPRPNLASVCTSPEFTDKNARSRLLTVVRQFTRYTGKNGVVELPAPPDGGGVALG